MQSTLLLYKSSCAVGTDGPGSKPQMTLVDIVLTAGVLSNLLVRSSEHPRSRICERLRIELRIFYQGFDVDVIAVRACPALYNVQCVAVRVGILINPDFVVFET